MSRILQSAIIPKQIVKTPDNIKRSVGIILFGDVLSEADLIFFCNTCTDIQIHL